MSVIVNLRYCKLCGAVIGVAGLCTFGCKYDTDVRRPVGTVSVRTFRRTDELLHEEDESARRSR